LVQSRHFSYKNPLWFELERQVLPFVTKPGRYVGNELNAIVKDHTGKFKIALAYADIYEIGMNYLGQQILYHLINSRDDCVAERVYQVWPDMEKRLRACKLPLFSLETTTPLNQFDALGFSVTYEMHAAGILNMLDLSGIPLEAAARTETMPLIIAGGPAILNPEPLADFFDVIYLGDAEESIHQIIDSLIKSKNRQKTDRLIELAQIEGVYVPAFYEPAYEQGRFASIGPRIDKLSQRIKIRSCLQLKKEHYPNRPIVPFIETAQDRLAIEIMRGCVCGCRFCQAGYQYRPRRVREAADIQAQIQEGIAATGFEDVTLLSLSSTDYPDLENMIGAAMPFFKRHNLALSLPSLRPGSLSPTMLEYLKNQRKTGITLAPEAGTQRLRDVLGKNITEEDIFGSVKSIFEKGWTLIKLYFMIGLPTETAADIDGLIDTINEISRLARSMGGKKNINVTISPFCPKPGTPWQWERQIDIDEIQAIYDKLASSIRSRNVTLKFRDPELAVIEGALSRGDRRFSDVVIGAYNNGARLDGWSEHFKFDAWEKAITESGLKIGELLQAKFAHQALPWAHIDKGISAEFLLKERDRSFAGLPPPGAHAEKSRQAQAQSGEFGRAPKKRVIVSAAPTRARIRVKYVRDERIRFYSHLDMIRAIIRTIRRANLPVSYSQGYHPHMKLSFGPPLPMGYLSQAEYFDMQLDSPFEKNHLIRLNECSPSGLQIVGFKLIIGNVESLTKILNCASYQTDIKDHKYDLRPTIEKLRADKNLNVTRIKEAESKQFEVGRFLHELSMENETITMLLGFTPDGYLRPTEVMQFGLGLPQEIAQSLIYTRTGQYLLQGIHRVEPLDLV